MPERIPLGWFHTIMGIIALLSGGYTLYKYKEITLETRSSLIYLGTTFITAATAMFIFQHGVFGPGHALGIMTFLALAVGLIAAKTQLFGRFSRQFQAIAFTGTLLFHCIPAVTDGLLRLPVGNPVLDTIESPVLLMCYLALLVAYLVGVTLQIRWMGRQVAA